MFYKINKLILSKNIKDIEYLFITKRKTYELKITFENKKFSSLKETRLIVEPEILFKSIFPYNFKNTEIIIENNDISSLNLKINPKRISSFLNFCTNPFLKIYKTFLYQHTDDLRYFIKFSKHKNYYINTQRQIENKTISGLEKVLCIFCKENDTDNLYDNVCYLDENTRLNELELNDNIISKLDKSLIKRIKTQDRI